MKNIIAAIAMAMATTSMVHVAAAENLTGKLGATGRIGFTVPADSDWQVAGPLDSDTGVIFGGGVLYGITRNIAAEIDITHSMEPCANA